MLVVKKRIKLDREPRAWVRSALALEGVVSLGLQPRVATEAALLGEDFEGDPIDRMIYASARDAGAPLVTADRRMRSFDPRGTVWD